MGMQKPKVKFKGRVIGKFPTVEPKDIIRSNPDPVKENVTTENAQVRSETLSFTNLDHILQLRLSELARRDIAMKIYSEILNCELWLCSNNDMAAQLKQDDAETVIYTVDELRRLIKLNPDPEELKAIHNIKSVFPASTIMPW